MARKNPPPLSTTVQQWLASAYADLCMADPCIDGHTQPELRRLMGEALHAVSEARRVAAQGRR